MQNWPKKRAVVVVLAMLFLACAVAGLRASCNVRRGRLSLSPVGRTGHRCRLRM